MKSKNTQIVFSEEIDSAINGYAIGISFTGIGVFLLLKPDYFAIPTISYIIGAIIGIFGVLGVGIELSKRAKVKGLIYIFLGAIFICGWVWGYLKFNSICMNILIFLLLIMGCYAFCLGFIQSVYSIFRNIKNSRNAKNEGKDNTGGSAATQIILFLTQLCALLVAVINVLKAIQ